MEYVFRLLTSGAGNLAAYLAAHVLLCLVPAFFIAGAMTALIPKSSITRWLGRSTPQHVSYPAGALAGSLLAVCSCTIVPLFAGIFRKGAGIGPAITFLFFAPAGNILALVYTGSILGTEFAFARFILCLIFGIGIGLIMALLFWRDDRDHDLQTDDLFADQSTVSSATKGLFLALVGVLIAGTIKLAFLSAPILSLHLPIASAEYWQSVLLQWVPFDAAKGEEGVSVQGALLILLLLSIAAVAWKGMENIIEEANTWTWVTLCLTATTLLVASLQLIPRHGSLEIVVTGRIFAVGLALGAVFYYGRKLAEDDCRSWLWESWRFVKQIFLLLLGGVFLVGVIRPLIKPEWIQLLAGENTVVANVVAVIFGVFMYFPTLVEVPIAHMFLSLGMHRGPLLAYLMSDPELSLQSMLMVAAVIGWAKTFAYVGLVAIFSVIAGLVYGAYIDGASPLWLGTGLIVFVSLIMMAITWIHRQHLKKQIQTS